MNKIILFFLCLFFSISSYSQYIDYEIDEHKTTKHQTTINGKKIKYKAHTGTQPVFNQNGKASAALFYTYYQRTDVDNNSERPLVISFNGGPGSASVWMHIAYTGPKILNIDNEGFPVQPYGTKNNPHSILDVADIVYVNPVNTAYSRAIKDESGEFDQSEFFGVNADISYLAEWINLFVTRNNKWKAPKFLIGESYGTTRVSGLANQLQNQHWMYLNGVILVSPTELGIERNGPVEIANRLPYYAATSWYHQKLPSKHQSKDLEEFLQEVEDFTISTLTPALVKGGFIGSKEKEVLASKMQEYTGIDARTFLAHNLEMPFNFFWKELLRDEGYTIGRLDSRYKGIDEKSAGSRPSYNAELTSWLHSFTPAINHYIKNELAFETDTPYLMFGNVHPWDRSKNNNTGKQLRQAMAQNPSLKVLIQSGYYDGATTYFNAKYTMWHIDESGKMKDRLDFKTYRSGHMMYLRNEDLEAANVDVRNFIIESIPDENSSIKY
ncbi:MAG: S10 family peptidase [Bacteroidota bacterium]